MQIKTTCFIVTIDCAIFWCFFQKKRIKLFCKKIFFFKVVIFQKVNNFCLIIYLIQLFLSSQPCFLEKTLFDFLYFLIKHQPCLILFWFTFFFNLIVFIFVFFLKKIDTAKFKYTFELIAFYLLANFFI